MVYLGSHGPFLIQPEETLPTCFQAEGLATPDMMVAVGVIEPQLVNAAVTADAADHPSRRQTPCAFSMSCDLHPPTPRIL